MGPRLLKDHNKVGNQQSYWDGVVNYFSNPWALLLLLYILYRLSQWLYHVVFLRMTEPLLERFTMWKERRREEQEVAEIKKNPDAHMAKVKAMEAVRMRIQEKHLEEAEAARLKREETVRNRQLATPEWQQALTTSST